jgi:hypothetical protein
VVLRNPLSIELDLMSRYPPKAKTSFPAFWAGPVLVHDRLLAASQDLCASKIGAVTLAKTVARTVLAVRQGKFSSTYTPTFFFIKSTLLRYYCSKSSGVMACCQNGQICTGPPKGCSSSGYSPCPNDTYCCRTLQSTF